MPQNINDQTVDVLKKYFVFDRIFDLCKYDIDMYSLYLDLIQLKKESYPSNYRFIFLHYETEYYFDHGYPGLTLTNLQRILSSLDISNFFCLVLSQQDISYKLKFLQKHETTDKTAIASIKYQNYYWSNDYFLPSIDPNTKTHSENISKKHLCLNRNMRFHRHVLFSLLKHNKLLDDGMVSYLALQESEPNVPIRALDDVNIKKDICLLETSTRTRVNDRWLLHDEKIKKCVSDVPVQCSFKNFDEPYTGHHRDLYPGYPKDLDTSLQQQCFLHIISETVYNYPSSFLTEKSFKPILCRRPFVIVGPSGSIKNLRSLGFRTFDRWWDESYDEIEDNETRMLAVIEIVKKIAQTDILLLKDICNQMENTLEYNLDFYIHHFKQRQIDSLHQFCETNLGTRYD